MSKKTYLILSGNNGATYILNNRDITTINISLKFYKAHTFKQKLIKNSLKIYLQSLKIFTKVFKTSKLKSREEILFYLKKLINQSMDFELDENCSVLISPTRDKIIIHHHGSYFHKFAFGKSYDNVKNEAKIYKLLNRPLQHFQVSKFYDFYDDGNYCSFKLSNRHNKKGETPNLILALVELFNITRQDNILFIDYLGKFKKRYNQIDINCNILEKIIVNLEKSHKNRFISTGLVHRDFKHWNINTDDGLLIYDFEEAVTDGLPLEDLLNYYIDPLINYTPASKITEKIFSNDNMKQYKSYLNKLQISIDFEVLLYCYLIEKILFYDTEKYQLIREKYISLLNNVVHRLEKNKGLK